MQSFRMRTQVTSRWWTQKNHFVFRQLGYSSNRFRSDMLNGHICVHSGFLTKRFDNNGTRREEGKGILREVFVLLTKHAREMWCSTAVVNRAPFKRQAAALGNGN